MPRDIRTGADFARYMSSLMTDVVEGSVTPAVVNAGVRAGSQLLRLMELQLKVEQMGTRGKAELILVPEPSGKRLPG